MPILHHAEGLHPDPLDGFSCPGQLNHQEIMFGHLIGCPEVGQIPSKHAVKTLTTFPKILCSCLPLGLGLRAATLRVIKRPPAEAEAEREKGIITASLQSE